MAHPPPSSESRPLVFNLAAFGRDLGRAASAGEALDLLLAYAWTTFTPHECLAGWRAAPTSAMVIRSRPPGTPSAELILELSAKVGPALRSGEQVDEFCRAATALPLVDNIADSWLLVPLLTGGARSGSLAIRGGSNPFTDSDLAAGQALSAATSVALERLASGSPNPAGPSWQNGLDAITPALCLIDARGSIWRANRAFAWLVTTAPDALVGRSWQSLVPPEWVPDLDRVIRAEGSAREVGLRWGDRVYAAIVAPVGGGAGGEVVLLLDDQTERHRLLDQLIQSEKLSAIGQLLAGVAHDLNNPLASVVGFAEFLAERPDVPSALREPVTIIRDEAERASGIVKNLLSFARKQERQRRPTAIQPLLEATLALLRNELMATRVDARLEIGPDLPVPVVDANQMQQVFVNLIHNAAQAIGAAGRPGTVTVRARHWADGVAVDVIDDGPGIPQALVGQVFDPFFTTKPEGQGTGLGLSISQGIVSEHGGRITLETAEGVGSTFTVYLPVGEESTPALMERPRATATGLRILVVDDEPHILHYMRATLESWGHSVAQAADGEEARERMSGGGFDLVIADLRMPRVGGRELYEELKRTRPNQAEQVVFATGDTVRGDTLAFLRSVGRPYLHKPFSLTELRALLAGVSKPSGE
jgi:two-component system NtrC family sensor kinase